MRPRAMPMLQSGGATSPATRLPEVRTVGGWECALVGAAKDRLENVLLGYLPQRRWFAGKARRMKTASIQDVVTVPGAEGYSYLASVVIGYAEGDPDTYMLPIAYANPAEASHILERWPMSAIAWVRNQGEESRGLLYDALGPPNFAEALLGAIARRRRAAGGAGTLIGSTTHAFARLRGPETVRLEAQLSVAEQSNNSVIFGERLMLKVFRRVEEGVNPELEVGRFLTEKANFAQIAPLAGSLEYRRGKGEPVSIAILQGYVPNQGDAWQFTLNTIAHYFNGPELVGLQPPTLPRGALEASRHEPGEIATRTIGGCPEPTRSLYERRLKRLAMRDVAGMLRSFSYASQAALRSQEINSERLPELLGWARFWVDSVSAVFLKSYLATAGTASWVPQNQEDLESQLTTMLLEKALYELRYELNLRPDWVRIPLRGILDLVTPAS